MVSCGTSWKQCCHRRWSAGFESATQPAALSEPLYNVSPEARFPGTYLFVRNNHRANETVQFRKFCVHIGVAAFEYFVLMSGTHPAAGAFSIAAVELLHNVPAFNNLAEGSKDGLGIERGVVAEVDVNLRGARSRAGVGKGDVTALLWTLRVSSGMVLWRQACATLGLPAIPNWTQRPGTTRKKRELS